MKLSIITINYNFGTKTKTKTKTIPIGQYEEPNGTNVR